MRSAGRAEQPQHKQKVNSDSSNHNVLPLIDSMALTGTALRGGHGDLLANAFVVGMFCWM